MIIKNNEEDKKLEESYKRIDFLQVKIICDNVEAHKKYIEEYKNNFEGIDTGYISFNQWKTAREIEALQFMINLY